MFVWRYENAYLYRHTNVSENLKIHWPISLIFAFKQDLTLKCYDLANFKAFFLEVSIVFFFLSEPKLRKIRIDYELVFYLQGTSLPSAVALTSFSLLTSSFSSLFTLNKFCSSKLSPSLSPIVHFHSPSTQWNKLELVSPCFVSYSVMWFGWYAWEWLMQTSFRLVI